MGFAGVIIKFVSYPSAVITLGRVFFSSAVLLIFAEAGHDNLKLKNKFDVFIAVFAGAIMAAHWFSFMHSIRLSTVAIGTITYSTYPVFVSFLEPLIYKEKFRFSGIMQALIVLFGLFITIPALNLNNTVTLGVVWGMIGSITYAVLSLLNRYLSSRYSGRTVCLYEQGTATILLLPALFIVKPSFNAADIVLLIILGVFCTAVAQTLFVESLKSVKVTTAGIVSGMETVYGIVLAIFILREIPSMREIIGGVIILSVALYTTLKK
jgi:drug/metabolite transporter (DMT)-like permease